ncbi:unnamed protein product, partial [Onchocerca flexuosa]|uniref:EF-1_beta_acid domain-containing protein n=1 Tax=Onchocerca flexuosa TaxID=387005 RepID=A0A183HXK2_9BILA
MLSNRFVEQHLEMIIRIFWISCFIFIFICSTTQENDILTFCDVIGGNIPLSNLQKQSSSSSKVETSLGASKEDDFDLFGSSDEENDEEKEMIKQQRLKAYAEKKAKKPGTIAKSSVILDVKPWDDTTDMQEMEKLVRRIEKDGLVWGGGHSILHAVCYYDQE